jgi:N6-L-threonylcarbamoyladenine synthase
MIILGIETSCDETSAAVLEEKKGAFSVLSDVVSSQISLHSQWGGVVPNLAAREHLKNIVPVIKESLKKAQVSPNEIGLVAITNGPGLIPALLIGTSAAKTLSYLWKKPLIGIHHIEGHIYANFIFKNSSIKFPILCLVVSGGHTQLILMKKHLDYKIIGETLDDAAGEAFDKVARILSLGYPGGPAIARRAMEFSIFPPGRQAGKSQSLNKYGVEFPRPMLNSKDFNFSFSGLKTAVLYETKKKPALLKNKAYISLICKEFQQAAVDVLIAKTLKAAKKYHPKTVMLAGGVAANLELRKQLKTALHKECPQIIYRTPNIEYSIDNAAMIAAASFYRWKEGRTKKRFQEKIKANWKKLKTDANLKLI